MQGTFDAKRLLGDCSRRRENHTTSKFKRELSAGCSCVQQTLLTDPAPAGAPTATIGSITGLNAKERDPHRVGASPLLAFPPRPLFFACHPRGLLVEGERDGRNVNGIPHIKARTFVSGRTVYFWNPPKFARETGLFRFVTLSTDLKLASRRAKDLNLQIEHYFPAHRKYVTLQVAKPGTTAWLAGTFEKSRKFSRYSSRTQKDYARLFRRLELFVCDGGELFGNLKAIDVTKHLAYSIYEYSGREPFVWVAFDEHLHLDFNHGTAFFGSKIYTRKMLIVCKFPVSE